MTYIITTPQIGGESCLLIHRFSRLSFILTYFDPVTCHRSGRHTVQSPLLETVPVWAPRWGTAVCLPLLQLANCALCCSKHW